MNKDEVIDEYVRQITLKMDIMPSAFNRINQSDKRHMENGFRYAVSSTIEILQTILEEKKENAFKSFVNKQLGLTPPTQKDIDNEVAKINLEKQKLELAKIRAQMSDLKKSGGDSPFAAFVKQGNEQNAIFSTKKKDNDSE